MLNVGVYIYRREYLYLAADGRKATQDDSQTWCLTQRDRPFHVLPRTELVGYPSRRIQAPTPRQGQARVGGPFNVYAWDGKCEG